MNLKLVEPLRELFKDEVRKIGIELGLPAELVMRHPFPGPGLGVRILGEVRPEFVEPLQKADHIFISELRKADLYDKVSQAFAVFSAGQIGRRSRRCPPLRVCDCASRGRDHRFHGPPVGRISIMHSSTTSRVESSTNAMGFPAWSMTFPVSPRRRSSGNSSQSAFLKI